MNRPTIAMLTVVALLGAAAGYLSMRALERRDAAAALRPASGLPPASAALHGPAPAASGGEPIDAVEAPPGSAVPEQVPDITMPDLAGKPHPLRSADGHARLFNFWASWCEPCRQEIPLLNSLQQQHAGEGLQVVGIAIDERSAVQKFIKLLPIRYLVLVGEDEGYEAAQKFGMPLALPFSVFADERNRIIAVKLGELHDDEAAAILAQMRALRTGTTSLEAARQGVAEALKDLAAKRSKQKAS